MTREHVGARLRAVRERLGWSVRELARRASLSDTLCHKIENQQVTPGIETLEALALALGVPVSWLAFGELPEVQVQVATNFEPLAVAARCQATIRRKHVIPDHAKYLEVQGGLAYLSLIGDASYRAMLDRLPLAEVAATIAASAGDQSVNCVFLGSGQARLEDRFLSLLLPRCQIRSITAVDISSGLLVEGGRRLCDRLRQHPHVKQTILHADFLTLPWKSVFSPDGVRVVTMFGYTYCNLSDPSFLADIPLNRDDLVLLDITLAAEPAANDPALARPTSYSERLREFLLSPLHRSMGDMTIHSEIAKDQAGYLVQVIATTGSERWLVGINRRYSQQGAEQIGGTKLKLVESWKYSDGLRALVLLRREQ